MFENTYLSRTHKNRSSKKTLPALKKNMTKYGNITIILTNLKNFIE